VTLISSVVARAAIVNLVIEQGTDFSHIVGLTNSDGSVFNLTGYDARMQIRSTVTAATTLYELTVSNGRIELNAIAGQLRLNIPSAVTAAMTWRSGVYDLEIISGTSIVTRIMQGNATLSLEVTR
jgi:hypothetical protein